MIASDAFAVFVLLHAGEKPSKAAVSVKTSMGYSRTAELSVVACCTAWRPWRALLLFEASSLGLRA